MLTLQFGQCGNQLGEALYKQITRDIQCTSPGTSFSDCYEYSETAVSKWFEGTSKDDRKIARALLIDTEKKVINKVLSRSDQYYCYRSRNVINPGNSGGSANNWAFGYLIKGPEFDELILEAVRKEVEKADRLDAFLCFLSCAGGTGSGLGSFIISSLRDEFPLKNIITAPVLPFSCGEVATQNYNTILSLAKITEDSDLIVMLENQRLNQELLNTPGTKVNFPKDLNDAAAQKILSVFQPARDLSCGRQNQVNYVISKVSPHPAYKLASIEAVPLVLDAESDNKNFPKNSGNYMMQFNGLKKEVSTPRGTKSISNVLVTRGTVRRKGKQVFPPESDDPTKINQLIDGEIYSKINWLDFSERMTHFHQKRNFLGNERFSSVVSNNSRIAKSLDEILASAWRIYTHGAFLHQYRQHGVEDDDFLRAFAKIESIVASYKSLRGE